MEDVLDRKVGGGATGALSAIGSWCSGLAKAARGLSPKAMSERIRAEAEAQAAACQVIKALECKNAEKIGEVLSAAVAAYGMGPFEAAMAKRCWSCPVEMESVWNPTLITPADACAMLRNSEWAARLAAMVPKAHWADRTRKESAYGWEDPEVLGRRGLSVGSVGPLLRLCAWADETDRNGAREWEGCLAALGPSLPPPAKDEALACMAMLVDARMAAAAFEAWLERGRLGLAVPEPKIGGGSARRSAL